MPPATPAPTLDHEAPPADRTGRRHRPAVVIAASVAIAVAINLALYGLGALAGADYDYTDGAKEMSVPPGGVVVLTAVPLALGMGLTALLARRLPRAVSWAQVAGPTVAVLTIGGTVVTDFDGPSTVALSLAHLTLVPVLVLGLARLRPVTVGGHA